MAFKMNGWSAGHGSSKNGGLTKNSSFTKNSAFKIGGKTDMSAGMTDEQELEKYYRENPTWNKQRSLEIEKEKKEVQSFIDKGGLDMVASHFGIDPNLMKTPPPKTNEEETRDFSMSKFESHKGPQSFSVDPMANVNQDGTPITETADTVAPVKETIPPPGHPARKAYYDSKGWAYDETVPGFDKATGRTDEGVGNTRPADREIADDMKRKMLAGGAKMGMAAAMAPQLGKAAMLGEMKALTDKMKEAHANKDMNMFNFLRDRIDTLRSKLNLK